MKSKFTLLVVIFHVLFLENLLALNDFKLEQLFNREDEVLPAVGINIFRKDFPYILINDINNSTNGKQLPRSKYLTIPAMIGSKYYSNIGEYKYDAQNKQWVVVQNSNYFIDYNFTFKIVPKVYVHHFFEDTLANFAYRTRFSFNSQHRPDTQWYDLINKKDTSFFAMLVYHYDSASRLTHLQYNQVNGYSDEIFYTYSNRKLISMLKLESKVPFTLPDSSIRAFYTYDTSGKMLEFNEEYYNAGKWAFKMKHTYNYNIYGNLASDKTYIPDSTGEASEKNINLYSYSEPGKMDTWIHMENKNGAYMERLKLILNYDGNKLINGYEYPWKDNDYSHLASAFYQFNSYDMTDIETVEKNQLTTVIYPNPVKNNFQINGLSDGAKIDICDLSGRILKTLFYYQHESVDISCLDDGTYLLYSDKMKPIKFIKCS